MKLIRVAMALSVSGLLLAEMASAAEPAAPEHPGLAVGQKAVLFTLKDQADHDVSLESLLKKGPVALVFFRSADWWPYCQKQLVQLQANLKELETTGGQVVAVSYDSTAILGRFAAKHSITYPLLSDVGSKTIEAYGILNREAPERVKGVPYPGTFVVGKDGVIRAKFFLDGYQERIDPALIREALQRAR